MKLYISGPMTGLPEFNFPAFNAAARHLRDAGFEVVNPADGGGDESKSWADYLRADLHLLLNCDGVADLPGWTRSKGARLENYVARSLGMPITSVGTWLANANDLDEFVSVLTT